MNPNEDAVFAAFEQMRQEAKKRFGRVPDLKHQGVVRQGRASISKKKGRPTGPDGRALPYRRDFESLDLILGREIKRRGWQRELAGGWVHSHWSEIVGGRIAQHTKVEMLKEQALFISCDSTAWATNLRMMQRQILQTIAKKVGANIIIELKIFGPAAPSWRKGPLHVKGRGPRDTYG